MAKAKLKEKKVVEEEVSVPEGMTAKDLSIEKRQQLFQVAFDKFSKDAADTFGLGLGCEIAYTPRAAVPRIVLIDLLKQENGQANPPAPQKEATA